MKIRFILFCCIILLVSSCSKKNVETIYIPEYLKQYGVFQVGSYWVFKNELTGIIDSSFIVSPPYFYFYQSSDLSEPAIQECDERYEGTFLGVSNLIPDDYSIGFKSGTEGNCLKNKTFQPGYIFQEDQFDSYKEINSFDSLIVNNVKYYNVLNTQYESESYKGDSILLTFYLVKSIGLIKYDQRIGDQDTTWSLLRYHIIQ